MANRDRFRLLGHYATPRFRFGAVVKDDVRGWVEIVGLSDSPIPWPIGKRGRAKSLVVYRGLARAIRRESSRAVCRAWGVTPQTVSKWRKALGVPQNNHGTMYLRRAWGPTRQFRAVQRKAWAKNDDPARCAKIAAAKRGVARPPATVERMRIVMMGRKLSEGTRRKMSQAHRRRGTRPPKAGRPWLRNEEILLRKLPPKEVAQRTGRTLTAVYKRRIALGLPDGRRKRI